MAAMTRTSTLMSCRLPSRENWPSCNTCSSLAWRGSGSSLISSRKMVPLLASSNLPGFSRWAPVKAPRSYPNSSLSKSSLGSAAEFTFTKGRSRRWERRCSRSATISLPTPLSPQTRTVTSVGATRPIRSCTVRMARLLENASPQRSRLSSSPALSAGSFASGLVACVAVAGCPGRVMPALSRQRPSNQWARTGEGNKRRCGIDQTSPEPRGAEPAARRHAAAPMPSATARVECVQRVATSIS